MNSKLEKFCNMIADYGIKKSKSLILLFKDIVKEQFGFEIDESEKKIMLKIFSFLNLIFAQGIWSNITDSQLRHDLNLKSNQSFILKTFYEICDNKEEEIIAKQCADLMFEFYNFNNGYINNLKEASYFPSFELDANFTMAYGLALIQEKMGIPDDDMNKIVPSFLKRAGDFADIEKLAEKLEF